MKQVFRCTQMRLLYMYMVELIPQFFYNFIKTGNKIKKKKLLDQWDFLY